MSKILLTRDHKIILLRALSEGFIYESDLNTIKGIDTIIPDKPMSRRGYEELLKKLKCQDYDQQTINDSFINEHE